MLNKVTLIGRLGKDPEMRYMPNGEAVCTFSVATSETWNDRNGNRQERTEWHYITIYRRLAEVAGQYLKKGSQVYLEGKIQSEKYTGKDGIERTAYKIIVNEMKMLGGKSDNAGNDDGYEENYDAPPPPPPASRNNQQAAPSQNQTQQRQNQAPQQEQQQEQQQAAPAQRRAAAPAPVDDIDDDIPF